MNKIDRLEQRIERIERELELRVAADGLPTVGELVKDCSMITGVQVAMIVGDSRSARFARCRFAIIYAARQEYPHSLPRIGRSLGGRDHTTIRSGYARALDLIGTDPEFAKLAEQLRAIAAARAKPLIDHLTSEGDEL